MNELFFSDYFPQIATEEDIRKIDEMITGRYVSERMKTIYRRLLGPQGILGASMFYADPLGINLLMMERLKTQSASLGYQVNVEDGHFISADGRHTMIIAHTSVPVTDSAGSKKLIGALKEKLDMLPPYISADIVSGHLHTLSNEKVIKRDIRLTIGIAAAGFMLLFLLVFRDIRAVLVFLIPAASVVLSMNISNLMIGSLSYWVAGLGTVIAGISVDYGIHVFVAVRNSGNASKVIGHVARPIMLGAVTTAGIFAAFFFSDIEGYHQLALFSIISIFLSLLLALTILPQFLSKGQWLFVRKEAGEGRDRGPRTRAVIITTVWALLLIAALTGSFRVKFDSDVVKLDGSEREVFQAEENFHETWGGKDAGGILVVSGGSYEEALEKNDRIFRQVKQQAWGDGFRSFSELWPSLKTRNENAVRWNEFWRGGKEEELRRLIRESTLKYGLRDAAFTPFFRRLYIQTPLKGGDGGEFISAMKERFVQRDRDMYRVLSFFPDERGYIDKLSGVAGSHEGTFIVSRKALSRAISETLAAEMKLFAMIATIFIVLLTLLFLKDLKKTLLALVPVITNVLVLLGIMSLFGISLNIANLIAGIVAMGLCIDYGIFMTYRYEHDLKRSAVLAVTISAVTTLIGAGVLLFARHPALFSIGLTLVIGVLAGYVSSVVVIPALEKIFSSPAGSE